MHKVLENFVDNHWHHPKVTLVTNISHFQEMMRFGKLIGKNNWENGRQRILETLFPSCQESKGPNVVYALTQYCEGHGLNISKKSCICG